MQNNTSYNLQNHTGEVSLDDLFALRNYFSKMVEILQETNSEKETHDSSIEGNGFNIAFPLNNKRFFLRVELDEREQLLK